jgi:indolepyruvate ferredoxin oxidoreductase alpha subunit
VDRKVLTGNEAVALGAWEAGVGLGIGYPGTPSTEILENLAKYQGPQAAWAVNEKVALEEAYGACMGGLRALVTMKHVGLNVAADPLFTAAYLGVNGGLVVVTADDPGMHSSQNEQDNRWYAIHAKVPMLEPADSTECREFTRLAFSLSERHDMPVLLRLVTRVSHSRSIVEQESLGQYHRVAGEYQRIQNKFVALPAHCRAHRLKLEQNLKSFLADPEVRCLNKMELTSTEVGIITAGAAYNYVKEAYGDRYSVLKLGVAYPLDTDLIREFAGKVQRLLVVEELDPYLELQIRALGISCEGKSLIPDYYELNPQIVSQALEKAGLEPRVKADPVLAEPAPGVPGRPPLLCSGCPHRGFFYTANREKLTLTGDIGCYTLGVLPPLNALDSCLCMGGGFTVASGLSLQLPGQKVFGVLGDSTFYHSGITGALDAVYNKRNIVPVVLDNRITAMTGHQENPGTGRVLGGESAPAQDPVRILEVLGYDRVFEVNAFDLESLQQAVQEAKSSTVRTALVVKAPCRLIKGVKKGAPRMVDRDKCEKCRRCLQLGCPAISLAGELPSINESACAGCGLCEQVCRHQAIGLVTEKDGE